MSPRKSTRIAQQSSALVNSQHSTTPSSSSPAEQISENGDSTAGILRPFNLSEAKLSHIQIAKNSTNRVKLYILCDQGTWVDNGTGHVACVQYPEDSPNWYLIVRLESNENNVLESAILNKTAYEKQEDKLIVWSESDTCDLALSFQEKSSCAAIWDKICQIQRESKKSQDVKKAAKRKVENAKPVIEPKRRVEVKTVDSSGKFEVKVKYGDEEPKTFKVSRLQRCDTFHRSIRNLCKIDSKLPMTISIVDGDIILSTSTKTIEKTKLKAGDTVRVKSNEGKIRFEVKVKYGDEKPKKFECWKSETCNNFHIRIRKFCKIDSKLPMTISIVGGDIIPSTSEKYIEKTKLKAGDTIWVKINEGKIRFEVKVKYGDEKPKKFEFWKSETCDVFYKRMRSFFKLGSKLPMAILIVGGDNIPNSGAKAIEDTKLEAGDTVEVITGITPTGRTTEVFQRANIMFTSYEDAERHFTETCPNTSSNTDKTFTVYTIVKKITVDDASKLRIDSDFFKLAQKCGTSQRKDVSLRFKEQEAFAGGEYKQIIIASRTNEEAKAEGFTSSETWAYGLEIAFGRLHKMFGRKWCPGSTSAALNQIAIEESKGRFSNQYLYDTLLGLIKQSVREDISEAYWNDLDDTLDLVVIGGYYEAGKQTDVYGEYLLACYNPSTEEYQSICKIGTGFSGEDHETQHEMFEAHKINKPPHYYEYNPTLAPDQWFEPKIVLEVKAATLSVSPQHRAATGIIDPSKGILLRFPRYLRLRDDKKPEDATTTKQVAEMYNSQEQFIEETLKTEEEVETDDDD